MTELYRKEVKGDNAIFYLKGKLPVDSLARLRGLFWKCMADEGMSQIVLELRELAVMDPSLLSLLVATQNMVRKYQGKLILVGLHEDNALLLSETKLDRYFQTCSDLNEAIGPQEP